MNDNRIRLIELEIARLEDVRRDREKGIAKIKGQRLAAGIAFFLGLAILIFAGEIFSGGFFILVGAVSSLILGAEMRSFEKDVDKIDGDIKAQREQMRSLLSET